MPLTGAPDFKELPYAISASSGLVFFWMRDGEEPQLCCVTHIALMRLGRQHNVEAAIEELFERYQELLWQIASAKFDAGDVVDDRVTILDRDIG